LDDSTKKYVVSAWEKLSAARKSSPLHQLRETFFLELGETLVAGKRSGAVQ